MMDELEQKIKQKILQKIMAEMQASSLKSLRDEDSSKIAGPGDEVLGSDSEESEEVEETPSGETEIGTMDAPERADDGDLMGKYKALRAMKRKSL